MTTQKLTREEKADLMFSDGVLVEKTKDGWLVPSSSGRDRYLVGVDHDIWYCNCKDFEFRGGYTLCYHILFVQMLQALETLHEQIEMVVA
jgi:SWIM zinc finger